MAKEKKTFLFNAKNGVFTANITETLNLTNGLISPQ